MKKLLLLGGLRYLIPVIKTAQELGIYVITCDYIPENIAHKYSNEYHNVNITDKGAVLELARNLRIDGIMSFAVDPGVLTAAYVAEKMGLPGCPYKSVQILQNKMLFRKYLSDNGFNVPKSRSFKNAREALIAIKFFHLPVIIKPVDAAGSKGVTKVEKLEQLSDAINNAIKNSVYAKEGIIEEFIQQKGYSSDSDSFSVDNDLVFVSFSNQYFDAQSANPFTPAAYSWPAELENKHKETLIFELQRLVKLLKLGTSVFNIEVRVGTDDNPYIMEVSPRGGGNRLSEMLKYATGVDLVKNAVHAAVGDYFEKPSMPNYRGYWAEVILHAEQTGSFKRLDIDKEIEKNNLVEKDLWVEPGETVRTFNAANDAIGTLVLQFNKYDELQNRMSAIDEWLKVVVE